MASATRTDIFILALRQQVIFPAMRATVTVSQDTFTELCDFCEKNQRTHIACITMRPDGELYSTGTWCRIASHQQSTAKFQDQETTVIALTMEGQCRLQVEKFTQKTPFHVGDVRLLEEMRDQHHSEEVPKLVEQVQGAMNEFMHLNLSDKHQEENQSPRRLLPNIFGNSKKARWPASPSVLADMVAAALQQLSIEEKQQVLDTLELPARLGLVLKLVKQVNEVLRLSKQMSDKVQRRSSEELRETVLKRQLTDLHREMRRLRLGKEEKLSDSESDEGELQGGLATEDDEEDQVASLREALKKAQLSADAQKIAQRELRRLQNIQPHHPEYSVCRTYLETLAGLPWALSSQDDLDLNAARDILEKDHYGLEKVKRRILEFLAVQKMRGDMKGPILCLNGPPGVGKTSLGKSVARALNRKFHRIALGGVRDEAEIRGHRRTYIGSMPGAILQALATLKVNNPVILLDEIDKLTRNAMFNPSGAMLELLDPEQNHTFKDHYINTPFDLSKVLFLCTCNDLNTIDRPLLDRMEVIELAGYTVEEKVHITTTHLLPKQRRLHGLEQDPDAPDQKGPEVPLLEVTPEAKRELIAKWTTESGVRSLERRVAQICRWTALRLAGSEVSPAGESGTPTPDATGRITVDAQHLHEIIGAEMYEPDLAERLTVGVAMGLAVTNTGGQLLFVEASRSKGSGRLTVTGQLGEVMVESVRTAMSLLRSRVYYAALATNGSDSSVVRVGRGGEAPAALRPMRLSSATESRSEQRDSILWQFARKEHKTQDPFGGDDIHVHFPAGAIPKDGPSAGVATTLALASLLLDRPVRSDTAVTGEVTLRGHVLPVGGVRDKVLAAHRAGIRHVLVPFGNQRHVQDEIPEAALADVDIRYVKHIEQALSWAFSEQDGSAWPPAAPGKLSGISEPRARL